MQIDFDPMKRQLTLDHRKLDMARAVEIFAGATITNEDDRKDYGEARFITVGILDDRVVVLVRTPAAKRAA
jgi:uncharacterized protein